MKYLFYDDEFYSDFSDFVERIEEEYDCDVKDLPEDFKEIVTQGIGNPIVQFTAETILESAPDDGYSEQYYEEEYKEILAALNKCIDFEKLNAMIPHTYSDVGPNITLTKADMIRFSE